tara:strand:+ start:650 stop:1396 length:747 start_codon:yes stop_codon:yes gene_type:complete
VKTHALLAFLLWAVLTAVGEVLAVTWDYFPLAAAREAEIVDDAFYALVVMSVPVIAFVLAAVIYSILRFRQRGDQLEDGPPIHTNRGVVIGWFTVTSLLTVVLIIFPGTLGLLDLRDHTDAEEQLVVQVQSSRWIWIMTYPEQGVTTTELVLPIGREVRFEVSATDVLHAFWVPAFRMKIDAVPGQKTFVYATPDRIGTFDDDPGYRLQCAELCGPGHADMRASVRVVEPGEFEAWVAENKPSASLAR